MLRDYRGWNMLLTACGRRKIPFHVHLHLRSVSSSSSLPDQRSIIEAYAKVLVVDWYFSEPLVLHYYKILYHNVNVLNKILKRFFEYPLS